MGVYTRISEEIGSNYGNAAVARWSVDSCYTRGGTNNDRDGNDGACKNGSNIMLHHGGSGVMLAFPMRVYKEKVPLVVMKPVMGAS